MSNDYDFSLPVEYIEHESKDSVEEEKAININQNDYSIVKPIREVNRIRIAYDKRKNKKN
jgi:hypothetical protein